MLFRPGAQKDKTKPADPDPQALVHVFHLQHVGSPAAFSNLFNAQVWITTRTITGYTHFSTLK